MRSSYVGMVEARAAAEENQQQQHMMYYSLVGKGMRRAGESTEQLQQ